MKKALALLMALSMLLLLCACGGVLGTKDVVSFENTSVAGQIDEEGTLYLSPVTDTAVKIMGDHARASISPDRQKAVVLEQDGQLTLFPQFPEPEGKVTIASEVASIISVKDTCALYTDKEDVVHRYFYADGTDMALGKQAGYYLEGSQLLYASDGKIFLLPADATEPEKIGSYESYVSLGLKAVSKNGENAIWCIEDGKDITVYLYENGEKLKLGTMTLSSSYGVSRAMFDRSGSCAVAYSLWADVLYLKPAGQEPIKYRLPNEPASGPYTINGPFSLDESGSIRGLYILVEGEKSSSLYYLDDQGEREKLLSGIEEMDICNGQLFYIDEDDTLFCAKLDGATVGDPARIASSVDLFDVPYNGDCVYYLKNCDDSEGSLYVYRVGDKEPTKISSGVGIIRYSWSDTIYSNYRISTDGKTVYYFKDMETDVGDTYLDIGTLYRYTYGDKESVKISSDVVTGSLSSGLTPGAIDPKSFMYMRYLSAGADRSGNTAIYANWVFYNGADSTVVAKDVIVD
ncbi:MAG: hypothetical protein IK095_00635 [Oscillospiraceae bacterium]|nr:hypothetical protein [Oscillospiraceae bacterium]